MKVLFVCLGNICRSPAAEGVFKATLVEVGLDQQVTVDSAGTGDWHVGERADPRMRQAAARRGLELTSRGRQVASDDFRKFDWIIAMDTKNYEHLKLMHDSESTARLIEFRDLISSKSIEGVPDPYYGGEQGFEEVLDILQEGCTELLKRISLER